MWQLVFLVDPTRHRATRCHLVLRDNQINVRPSRSQNRTAGVVKAVDSVNNTIAVTIEKGGRILEALPVAKDVDIQAEWLNVNLQAFESQNLKLSDLRPGIRVHLKLVLGGHKLLVKTIQLSE